MTSCAWHHLELQERGPERKKAIYACASLRTVSLWQQQAGCLVIGSPGRRRHCGLLDGSRPAPGSPLKALITSSFLGSEPGAWPGSRVTCHLCLLRTLVLTRGQDRHRDNRWLPQLRPGLWLPVTAPVVWRTPDLLTLQASTSHLLIRGASRSAHLVWTFVRVCGRCLSPQDLGQTRPPKSYFRAPVATVTLRTLTLSQNVPILFPVPSLPQP